MFNVTEAAASPLYPNAAAQSPGPGRSFQDVLSDVQASGADAAGDTSAASALAAALSQAGITIPPAIRITSGSDGYELSGDPRNDKFQAMVQNNPAVQNMLGGLIGAATVARQGALDQVVSDFLGKSGGAGLASFLEEFMRSEKTDAYSISFNGAAIAVDEMGAKGWEPVKDGADFTKDLIAAYTHYQLTHAVTIEKRKEQDDSDEDLQLRARLADLLKQDQSAAV